MTTSATKLVELRQVAIADRHDPATAIVRGIDGVIRGGECWVIGGPPGCGKSQLLETIAGLLAPCEGDLSWFAEDGTPIGLDRSAAVRGRVGLVFPEGGRPFQDLTVAQNVGLPLCYHRGCPLAAVATQVNRLLELTGLTVFGERLPGTLNRGLRQRVALARALALDPPVLLLDNPLSGLTASQSRWWLGFLGRRLHPEPPSERVSTAVVVATDDLRPWLTLGNEFALIDDRRWRVLGKRADVAASVDPVVRELLSDPT